MYAIIRIVDGHTQSLKHSCSQNDKVFSSFEHANHFVNKLNSNTQPKMHWHVNKIYSQAFIKPKERSAHEST